MWYPSKVEGMRGAYRVRLREEVATLIRFEFDLNQVDKGRTAAMRFRR